MNIFNEAALKSRLRRGLSPVSFSHSKRTAETAADLAIRHDADIDRARIAGLLHDVAKDLSDDELLTAAAELGLKINMAEANKPYLLHAVVGAKMITSDFGIKDEIILNAVKNHTFGQTEMTKLDKIVYLADVIEPGRGFSGLDEVREMADRDLDKAFAKAYKRQMIFIIEKGGYLHPQTVEVWNKILNEVNGSNG